MFFQISKTVRHLLSSGSDDTKSLFCCISILQMLLFYYGVLKDDFETHQKNFQMVKKVLGCNLVGRKMDIRALMVDRVQLQHELRVLESGFTLCVITKTTQLILQDLVQLATSQYSEVHKSVHYQSIMINILFLSFSTVKITLNDVKIVSIP